MIAQFPKSFNNYRIYLNKCFSNILQFPIDKWNFSVYNA